jgi:3-hydroxyacyl-CoA dehydrogenase / enoyl-CoA hydratase / 3-hydroxybutyryl-CoA epimerase
LNARDKKNQTETMSVLTEPACTVLEVPSQVDQSFVSTLDSHKTSGLALVLQFKNDPSPVDAFLTARAHAGRLRAAVRSLEQRDAPLIGVIQGDLAGFGFELALACHARFFSDPKIHLEFGLLRFGLIPFLGTTQRLPWLAGVEITLRTLLFEEVLSPDALVGTHAIARNSNDEMEAVKAWIRHNPRAVQPWDKGHRSLFHSQELTIREQLQRSYLQIRNKTSPGDEVFTSAFRCFHDGWERSFDGGIRIEEEEVRRLDDSASAQNRQRILFHLRAQADASLSDEYPPVRCLAVLGAGLMGTGIALTAARAGCKVRLFDVSAEALARAKAKMLQGKEGSQLSDRVQFLEELDDVADADFVVEAVFERPHLKKDLLRRVVQVVGENAIVASNTTTLPISSLAEACGDPSRFIGTHFFSPVERMELLEIIMGSATAEKTLDRALGLAKTLKKTAIVVRDGPGFYTSRVVIAYAQEALFLLREGVSPWMIDNVARNAGMPIGPLAMADVLSLDLLLDIARSLAEHARGAAKFAGDMVELLSQFEGRGRLGRKTAAGIYDYPRHSGPVPWRGLSDLFPAVKHPIDAQIIEHRLFVIQTLETLAALKEKIIDQPDSADLASVLGWGYPAFKGGPMGYIDYLGGSEFEAVRSRLEAAYGNRFAVP